MKTKMTILCLLLALLGACGQDQSRFSGGGKDIRLVVGLPEGRNLDGGGWLAEFVRGSLTGDFQKYSAMTVTGRQDLEKILAEQKLPETDFYGEKNYARVGQLTRAQYILTGSITRLPEGNFSLQLDIRDLEKGGRKAAFTRNCMEDELQKAVVLKEAAFELLTQMGVSLTAEAKQALYEVKSGAVAAETALARGITAQKSGTVVEALTYYYNAVGFDPSLAEAAGRLEALSGEVAAGGTIGQNARNDIQRREACLKVMQEAAAFFKDHKPYEIVYDPTLYEGKTDYQKETVELGFNIALWPASAFGALDNILAGMAEKIDAWGFKEWPLRGEGAVFARSRQEFTVDAILLDDTGRTIAARPGVLHSEIKKDGSFVQGSPFIGYMPFTVKAGDISDTITVKITGIDGMDVEAAGQAGYMRISAAGTEYKIGDTGPAGGIIFFTMCGGGKRYLEAAPADLSDAQWGAKGKRIAGTETRTGSGKKNTYLIMEKLKELGEGGKAAQICAGYELHGYRDWFLPSKDELDLMYKNLKQKGLGNFKDAVYCSSSEYSSYHAWSQDFGDGRQGYYRRYEAGCVRSIRAF